MGNPYAKQQFHIASHCEWFSSIHLYSKSPFLPRNLLHFIYCYLWNVHFQHGSAKSLNIIMVFSSSFRFISFAVLRVLCVSSLVISFCTCHRATRTRFANNDTIHHIEHIYVWLNTLNEFDWIRHAAPVVRRYSIPLTHALTHSLAHSLTRCSDLFAFSFDLFFSAIYKFQNAFINHVCCMRKYSA